MTDVVAGRYALVDPIGAGGSGTVWRAFDRRQGGYCAAKLLRQRDAGELLRFVREQSVRLAHPNIVSPYSWAAEDGAVLIASELVSGGSLHTLIGDYGPLAEGTVVTVLRQVLAGLGAVHDAELIHRDVKPGNVLLHATATGPLRLVLTDFGLTISRRDARLTQVGMVIGTPGYLPPEVLVGGVPPDPRHDLYAVGRLALTLLAGDEPEGPGTTLVGGIRDPALRRTVEALLRRDPADRPPDAAAVGALLADAREDDRPRGSDGEWIDVVDQLPPLPAGWTPSGPRSPLPADGPPRATVVDVLPTAPMAGAPSGGVPITPSVPAPAPARRRGPVVAAVVGVAVLVAGVLLALRPWAGTTDDPTDPSTVTTGVTTAITTTGPTTTGSSITPSATVVPTTENLRVGDACSWQQEGDRRPGVDGMLVCTLVDGGYQWRAA